MTTAWSNTWLVNWTSSWICTTSPALLLFSARILATTQTRILSPSWPNRGTTTIVCTKLSCLADNMRWDRCGGGSCVPSLITGVNAQDVTTAAIDNAPQCTMHKDNYRRRGGRLQVRCRRHRQISEISLRRVGERILRCLVLVPFTSWSTFVCLSFQVTKAASCEFTMIVL